MPGFDREELRTGAAGARCRPVSAGARCMLACDVSPSWKFDSSVVSAEASAASVWLASVDYSTIAAFCCVP